MTTQPIRDMRRRQRRRRKVHALRLRLGQTTHHPERQRLIAKIRKLAPGTPLPEK